MLLDTNVLVWILLHVDAKISKRAFRALSAPGARLFVSVISIWEILLKRHAGKLWIHEDPDTIVRSIQSNESWRILPLEVSHMQALNQVERFTDHQDPFDRVLIAQAHCEGLRIMTAAPQFSRYKIEVVW